MDDTKRYWLGFSLIPSIGPVRFSQLEAYFNDMARAWHADASELKQAGLDASAISAISQARPGINVDKEAVQLERSGISLITWHDAEYPDRLKEIYNRPAVLFTKGTIKPDDEWCIAVVGTRRPTIYGRQVAEEIASQLAYNHVTVVSGLAKGIDTISHRAALSAGGRSLAVLGGGLDVIYPAENTELARQMTECGALLSEYPPATRPRPEFFPRRNRIIAGLSLGTLVIEAGETSGALITAQLALEQNREVFAIPGSILSKTSAGTNKLIQEGAKLVVQVSDILEELNLKTVARQTETQEAVLATSTEGALLKYLSHEPRHIDEICELSQMPTQTVSSTLAIMELKGVVKQVSVMHFALAREQQKQYTVMVE